MVRRARLALRIRFALSLELMRARQPPSSSSDELSLLTPTLFTTTPWLGATAALSPAGAFPLGCPSRSPAEIEEIITPKH